MHFHWTKVENIIHQGGSKLVIQLYNSTLDDGLADTDVVVSTGGVKRTLRAGNTVALSSKESITLPVRYYHRFWGTESRVLVGEVSLVNDYATYYQPNKRHEA
jgi:D-lyxose ketol-isomerase